METSGLMRELTRLGRLRYYTQRKVKHQTKILGAYCRIFTTTSQTRRSKYPSMLKFPPEDVLKILLFSGYAEHNAQSLLCSLPDDVLQQALGQALWDEIDHCTVLNVRDLASISLVCQRLRHLLLDTHLIWAYIDTAWPLFYQRRCLKRAHTHLLTLKIRNAASKSLDQPHRALSLLGDIVDRVVELQIGHKCKKWREGCVIRCRIEFATRRVFSIILQQGLFPSLRRINYEECYANRLVWTPEVPCGPGTTTDPMAHPWQHLTSLTMHNTQLKLDAPLPALKKLTLHQVYSDVDLIMLRGLLNKTTSLESLSISGLSNMWPTIFVDPTSLITNEDKLRYGFGAPEYKMEIHTLQTIVLSVDPEEVQYLLALLPHPKDQCVVGLYGSRTDLGSSDTASQDSLESFREWLVLDDSKLRVPGFWTLRTSQLETWPDVFLWQARWSPITTSVFSALYEAAYSPHNKFQGLDGPIRVVSGYLHHISPKTAFSALKVADVESIQEVVIFGKLKTNEDIASLRWWIKDLSNTRTQPVPEITFCISYGAEQGTLTQQLREVFDTVPALSRVWKCLKI
jgi:hypothetical protein